MTHTRAHTNALALYALLLFAAMSAPAQDVAAGERPKPAQTVLLNVMVTDGKGHTVAGVKREDLRLYVDGVEQPITYFSNEGRPVSYGLVVDNSGSLRHQINYVLAAAKLILNHNGPEDETFVLRFINSKNITVVREFTADTALLGRALDAMYVQGGQTALIDALYLSAEYLTEKARPAEAGARLRALVLISDGEDRQSRYKAEDLFKLLGQSGVQVFCIGLVGELENDTGFAARGKRDKAKAFLERLASQTGGRVSFVLKTSELEEAVNEVAEDLHAQLVLGFTPPQSMKGDAPHKIEVKVVSRPGGGKLKAVTRPEITLAVQNGAEGQKR